MAWSREGGWLDWTGPGQDSRDTALERQQRRLLTGITAHCESGPQEHGRQSRYSPVFTILDRGLAKAGPVQKWGVPASVCAGGEDAVL